MRIERSGTAPLLTPRIIRFLEAGLKARSLDDPSSQELERPDYTCFNGLFVIELKTLEDDGSERVDNLTDELRKRDDFPIFLGSAPIESVLKNMSDPDPVRRKLTERVGRSIRRHLRKSNSQLGAHATREPRKNMVRIVLIVNEDNELYEPRVVGFVVSRFLAQKENGRYVHENVDAVIYLTERHATTINGQIAFPTLAVMGPAMDDALWKEPLVQLFSEKWAEWNKVVCYDGVSQLNEFATIDHIPDHAPRHEFWRIEYRRNPYMRNLPKDELRNRFDETLVISLLAFVKGSPTPPSTELMMENMRVFTHVMMEMAERAIPVTEFPQLLEREQAAAVRLGLPSTVVDWLAQLDKTRRKPTDA
jgi:hypothetical protein